MTITNDYILKQRLAKIANHIIVSYRELKKLSPTYVREIMDENLTLGTQALFIGDPMRALSYISLLLHESSRAFKEGNVEMLYYLFIISEIKKAMWPELPWEPDFTTKGKTGCALPPYTPAKQLTGKEPDAKP